MTPTQAQEKAREIYESLTHYDGDMTSMADQNILNKENIEAITQALLDVAKERDGEIERLQAENKSMDCGKEDGPFDDLCCRYHRTKAEIERLKKDSRVVQHIEMVRQLSQAQDDNQKLREENEKLKKELQGICEDESCVYQRKAETLREALKKYGRHSVQCGINQDKMKSCPCICGLDQALSEKADSSG